MGPFQSKLAKARTNGTNSDNVCIKMVTPNGKLAGMCCEQVWKRKPTGELQVTNWSGEPISIEQGTVIGNIEEVSFVELNDSVWETLTVDVARVEQGSEGETGRRHTQALLKVP